MLPRFCFVRIARVLFLTQVLQAGSWVMVEADQFLQRFFTEADAQASPVPLQRMNVADRQIALARQIFKEFLMTFVSQQSDPNITSSESLSQSISAFSTAHQSLRYGGNGIPELSPVRLDVQKQWETIGRAWSTFEAQLHEPPSWDELEKIQVDLTALVVELEVAVPLFAIKDEELRGDPWPAGTTQPLLGLLASLLGARTLLGAPGHTTRNKKRLETIHICKFVLVCFQSPLLLRLGAC